MKTKARKKADYMMMEPLKVYELVRQGKLYKFPNHYLDKDAVKEIVRYIILDVYKYTREDVIENINHKFFQEHFLGGARKVFDECENEILVYSFPEWDFKYWEFRRVSPKFWEDKNNQKEYLIWIAGKKGIDLSTKEGLRKITADFLNANGGINILKHSDGIFELLNLVACNKYQKWEIMKVDSWSKEEVRVATRWLIEEKLKLSEQEVCKIKVSDFTNNNLDGMLQKACGHSILTALEIAYPGKYYRVNAKTICLKK